MSKLDLPPGWSRVDKYSFAKGVNLSICITTSGGVKWWELWTGPSGSADKQVLHARVRHNEAYAKEIMTSLVKLGDVIEQSGTTGLKAAA